jgi:hypothetical protein
VDGASGEVIATELQRPIFRACRGHIVRLSLQVTDQSSGKSLYSGAMQERFCKRGIADALPAMSDALVLQLQAALRD